MTSAFRYDHAAITDHVSAQANLVAHMQDLRTRALHIVSQVATVWTAHGSDAGQQAMQEISLAFDNVFRTIERHGAAQAKATGNASLTDNGVAAGFRGLSC